MASWDVPTIHERVLRDAARRGISASFDDDAQAQADRRYDETGSYEMDDPEAEGLPLWDMPR